MKFSLIIGTLNRREAIESCLKSILEQIYSNYEIIIIDQSDNTLTKKYIEDLNCDKIKYKKVNYKGLSRARNEGLKMATGSHFCLIDDDAYYDKYYLKNASEKLINNKLILSGYIFDTVRNNEFAKYNPLYDEKTLSLRMVMNTCPSAALIFPMSVIDNVGYFDESLGVGGKYGAAEETDLLIRCIERRYRVIYSQECSLKHPVPFTNINKSITHEKQASYYSGIGALYKKHYINKKNKKLAYCYYELWFKLYIKKLLRLKFDFNETKMCIEGFKYGLNNYKGEE